MSSTSTTGRGPKQATDIVDRLERVSQITGYGIPKVFTDWVDWTLAALEGDNDTYHSVLTRLVPGHCTEAQRHDVSEELAKAFSDLVIGTSELQRPIIGDVYEIAGASSSRLGQYFTPWALCVLKAKLCGSSDEQEIKEATAEDPFTVHDPTCGSGRLMIAYAKAVHDIDPKAPVVASGVDKSAVCAKMAVINLIIAGVSGWIIHGDSLTLEFHTEWHVDFRGSNPQITRIDDPEQPGGN